LQSVFELIHWVALFCKSWTDTQATTTLLRYWCYIGLVPMTELMTFTLYCQNSFRTSAFLLVPVNFYHLSLNLDACLYYHTYGYRRIATTAKYCKRWLFFAIYCLFVWCFEPRLQLLCEYLYYGLLLYLLIFHGHNNLCWDLKLYYLVLVSDVALGIPFGHLA